MNTEWMGRENGEDAALERELAEVLGQRAEVPEGFAERVLARAVVEVPAGDRGRLLRWRGGQSWAGWAVAAGLTVGVFAGGGVWERQRLVKRRAAEMTVQFEVSQAITDQAMERVRTQMRRAGVDLDGVDAQR